MQLFEFEFELPSGFVATTTAADPDGTCIDMVGQQVDALADSIVNVAEAAGFVVVEQTPGRRELERGEQRILLIFASSTLTLQTQDPAALPVARCEGTAVILGDFRVDFGSAAIVPLRERYTGDSDWRRGAWRLRGITASEVVEHVVEQAVTEKGLARGPIFAPPKGGIQAWTGEAHSREQLVKARATVEVDHVLLELDVVDKREREETKTRD